ncbi:MAG: 2-phospho-L-lactate transferase [Gammaproteobacteria bacterium]|nr:2-phospho-L-lactate transferase [Gammaproteobacteria bacterium]
MSGHVVALCGGVGGAKLAQGLARVLPGGDLTLIVNTGDDFRHLGLWVSPDIDAVVYALANLADPVRGWGRREESWNFMAALAGLGGATWFQLGDQDLAMHVERSWRLAAGEPLSVVTERVRRRLGIGASILPMSDDPVSTRVHTAAGWLEFQEYFVHQRCEPAVRGLDYLGAATARPLPAALDALARADLRAVVICPSNPFLSIEPILALPALRQALERAPAPRIGVTPIIGGEAVKGPAAKMLRELGFEASSAAVARRYAGFVDLFVSDTQDPPPAPVAGVRIVQAPTLMSGSVEREALARELLRLADVARCSPGGP